MANSDILEYFDSEAYECDFWVNDYGMFSYYQIPIDSGYELEVIEKYYDEEFGLISINTDIDVIIKSKVLETLGYTYKNVQNGKKPYDMLIDRVNGEVILCYNESNMLLYCFEKHYKINMGRSDLNLLFTMDADIFLGYIKKIIKKL